MDWGSSERGQPGHSCQWGRGMGVRESTFDIAVFTIGDLIRSFLKRFSISSLLVAPEQRQAMVCAGFSL
jgi:hypothetical protein